MYMSNSYLHVAISYELYSITVCIREERLKPLASDLAIWAGTTVVLEIPSSVGNWLADELLVAFNALEAACCVCLVAWKDSAAAFSISSSSSTGMPSVSWPVMDRLASVIMSVKGNAFNSAEAGSNSQCLMLLLLLVFLIHLNITGDGLTLAVIITNGVFVLHTAMISNKNETYQVANYETPRCSVQQDIIIEKRDRFVSHPWSSICITVVACIKAKNRIMRIQYVSICPSRKFIETWIKLFISTM